MPDGRRLTRRFDISWTIDRVFDWIGTEAPDLDNFALVSNYPRVTLTPSEAEGRTFEQVGLHPQAAFMINKLGDDESEEDEDESSEEDDE